MVDEVKKGIRGIRVPSKRISDTIGDDLFKKKIMQAGFDGISDFNAAFKAAGGELGDLANKTKFLNSFLPKEEAPYRNIMTDRLKSKYEILSGGATPGTRGAPENKVYWQAASAAEKEAIEKFPKDTKLHKQKRLTHVKKFLKNAGVPAKWLLNNLPKMGLYATAGISAPISAIASAMLYAGTSKPAKGALPEESLKDKVLRDIDFSGPSANAQLLEQMSQDATMKAGGGMMNINEMTRPLGYKDGTKDGTLVGDKEALRNLKFMIPRDEEGNIIPFKKSDPKPFMIPRDKDGNIIPFKHPDPKPFMIPRDEEGNRIPFDAEKGRQLLSSGNHPLVEFKEMYEAWIIDGGKPMPMWDFIEMVTEGIKKG